jgi:hypothetical protein
MLLTNIKQNKNIYYYAVTILPQEKETHGPAHKGEG